MYNKYSKIGFCKDIMNIFFLTSNNIKTNKFIYIKYINTFLVNHLLNCLLSQSKPSKIPSPVNAHACYMYHSLPLSSYKPNLLHISSAFIYFMSLLLARTNKGRDYNSGSERT